MTVRAMQVGATRKTRRWMNLTLGKFCAGCLAHREFTFQGREMQPGRSRRAVAGSGVDSRF